MVSGASFVPRLRGASPIHSNCPQYGPLREVQGPKVLNLNQSQTSGKLTKAVELDLITTKEINDWKKGSISDPTYMDGVEEVTFGEQEPPLLSLWVMMRMIIL